MKLEGRVSSTRRKGPTDLPAVSPVWRWRYRGADFRIPHLGKLDGVAPLMTGPSRVYDNPLVASLTVFWI